MVHWCHIKKYVGENNNSNIVFWINLFDRCHRPGFSDLLSKNLPGGKAQYRNLEKKITNNIKKFRDNFFHGVFIYQENLKDIKIKECNKIMLEWINIIKVSMKQNLGYDGLGNIKPLVKGITEYQFDKDSRYEDVKNYIESYRYR